MTELTLDETLKKMSAKVIMLSAVGVLPTVISSQFLKDLLEMTILHSSGDELVKESIARRDKALDTALSLVQPVFSGPIHRMVESLRDSTKNLSEVITNTLSGISPEQHKDLLSLLPEDQLKEMGLKPAGSTLH